MRRPNHNHVLVVDDDVAIRQLLRVLLERAGYTVAEVDDGERALAALHNCPHPLVVLLDVAMPRRDGIGVLRTVAQHAALRARHVYILMTASDSGAPRREAAELLAQIGGEFLPKPFSNRGVLRVVGRAAQRLPAAIPPLSESRDGRPPASS